MVSVDKIIKDLEKKFSEHEIWTSPEIKEVLNQKWLEINPPEKIPICQISKKELADDEMYLNEDDDENVL